MIIFISGISLFSQNIEPSPLTFNIYGSNQQLSPSLIPQNEFIKGYQWGGHPKFVSTENMTMNQEYKSNLQLACYPNYSYIPPNKIKTTMGSASNFPQQANSYQFHPALIIPNDFTFQTLQDDPWHPVFGFMVEPNCMTCVNNQNMTIVKDASNVSRLKISNTDAHSNDGIKVLCNSWPKCEDFCRDAPYDKDNNGNVLTNSIPQFNDKLTDRNGYYYYLSINLRRSAAANNETLNTAKVLTLKLKYTLRNGSSDYIKFSEVPSNASTAINYNGNRGNTLVLQGNSESDKTNFVIYQDLIPLTTATDKDITISAKFICDNQPIVNNPPFPEYWNKYSNEIKSLDIELYNHGNTDVEICYIRVENGLAHDLFFGMYDNTDGTGIATASTGNPENSLHQEVQAMIGQCESSNTYDFFRIYGEGGDDGLCFSNWGTLRYLNKLFGGLVLASMSPEHPKHYWWYIGGSGRWGC